LQPLQAQGIPVHYYILQKRWVWNPKKEAIKLKAITDHIFLFTILNLAFFNKNLSSMSPM